MEATKNPPPGLRSRHRSPQNSRTSSSIAPVSPDEPTNTSTLNPDRVESRQRTNTTMSIPHVTAGQFSFAPATRQTTITTTTTTTVSLAPLLIKPPTNLLERDPREYPLAFHPTPAAMKRFGFDMGDSATVYREAEDAHNFLANYEQQQTALLAANGSIVEQKKTGRSRDSKGRLSSHTALSGQNSRHRKRTASPPSLAEAAELASLQKRRKKPRSQLSQLDLAEQVEDARSNRDTSNTLPVTPDTEVGHSRMLAPSAMGSLPRNNRLEDITNAETRRSFGRGNASLATATSSATSSRTLGGPLEGEAITRQPLAGALPTGAVATPPLLEEDLEPATSEYTNFDALPRPAPSALLNGSQRDASLPSPSLSPVTAAANLARSHALGALTTEFKEDGNASEVSGLDLEDSLFERQISDLSTSVSQPTVPGQDLEAYRQLLPSDGPTHSTLMDIPTMVRTFDTLPEELQSYVMFHMLKRCSKRTLHTVAAVVNPALKCDPFHVLPVEIGLQITKFLDGKSLCRAAQVSKRWRHLINSDEKAWKDLLDRDGFTLPEGEVERAVREGWGWQFPGSEESETNLAPRKISRNRSELEALSPLAAIDSDDAASSASTRTTRLKRKAATQLGAPKRQKRKVSTTAEESLHWMRDLAKAQGPIAYASAAAKAIPNPNLGLPTLSSLHLFKSIYQRHCMIRNSWMDSDSQPHHLAFRAHHRHVVTCLLFDSDRIITGSDDTSINVYDTKTGELRKKLEGHEGGVWALSCDGNTLVSGSTDRSVRVWDITTGKCMQTFQGHTSTVRCLVILKPTQIGVDDEGSPIIYPEEPVIITGSRDSTLRVWKLPQPGDASVHQAGPTHGRDNPYALRTLSGHHNSVRAIAAHADTLVSGSYDSSVRVWKISNGELLHRLQGHTQKVYSVVLDYDRGRCISGSMDNLVKVWSLDTGVCLFNLEGHTSLVGLLDLSYGQLVSAAADSTLRIWDPDNGNCRSVLSAHTGAITCFQHDGQKVVSGSDRTLKMWNVETGEFVRDLLSDLSGVWQVRFDERRCVAAVQRNNLTYIEVLDFGASRDGVAPEDRGRRIVVNARGHEIDDDEPPVEVPAAA